MNQAELPIANPCTVDWTTMTLADRGRFCGECKKVVRELAQVTEREARALLAALPTEGLCVRYVHNASGEIIFRPDVSVGRLARMRRAATVAAAAVGLPMAAAGCIPTMGAISCPVPQASAMPETMGAITIAAPPADPQPAVVIKPPAPESACPVRQDPR